MKKLIKRLILALLTVVLVFVGYVGIRYALPGYRGYQAALEECPLSEKVESIRQRDNYITLDQLPPIYTQAVLAVEDHNYYRHGAASIWSTTRAVLVNLQSKKLVEGGSTITQQVAKNLYFEMNQSLVRKFSELFMAMELERHYSKDDILELYINSIYYGSGYYCLADAAAGYYGVAPAQLTDYQATLLAGVPNAPSVYSPDNHNELTGQRHRQVLDAMVKYKYISSDQAQAILEENGGVS